MPVAYPYKERHAALAGQPWSLQIAALSTTKDSRPACKLVPKLMSWQPMATAKEAGSGRLCP